MAALLIPQGSPTSSDYRAQAIQLHRCPRWYELTIGDAWIIGIMALPRDLGDTLAGELVILIAGREVYRCDVSTLVVLSRRVTDLGLESIPKLFDRLGIDLKEQEGTPLHVDESLLKSIGEARTALLTLIPPWVKLVHAAWGPAALRPPIAVVRTDVVEVTRIMPDGSSEFIGPRWDSETPTRLDPNRPKHDLLVTLFALTVSDVVR